MKLFRIGLLGLLFTTPVQADTIEIMHFWVSDSEAAAIDVFAQAYQNNGDTWIEDRQPNRLALHDNAYARLREGFPPTAMQWSVAPDLYDMVQSGVSTHVNDVAPTELINRINPLVCETLDFDGNLAAVPVGLHGNNWSYYNTNIVAEFRLTSPESWTDFLDQMDIVADAGRPTIAIGSGIWERGIVLDAMMLEAGGEELLLEIKEGEFSAVNVPKMEVALGNLIRFVDIVHGSGVESESWNTASLDVATGRATVQVMGDWAKGELVNARYVPGEDFLCHITPSPANHYLVTLDVFALPLSTNAEDQRAQRRFVEVVLDPVNQAEFSRRKGALPVINDVDLSLLDICGRRGLAALQGDESSVLSVTRGRNPAITKAMDTVIEMISNQEISSETEAFATMLSLFEAARGDL